MMDWEQLQQQIRQLENEFMKYQDVQGNSSIPKAVHKMVLIENIMSRRERGLI